jgi:opacity protein-like surface antigen
VHRLIFAIPVLFLAVFAYSGEYWHVEPGAGSMKVLSMPTEPRQAALAGAGIASPKNTGETMRNPLAGTVANSPVISFSKSEFSDYIGAGRVAMLAHSAFGDWHLTAGMESLNYDKIQGYSDDGLTSDGDFFTAGTIAAQFGIAKIFNSMGTGLTFRYANQNIDDDNMHGFLFDGGVKYNLLKNFAFGAVFNNFGWISSESSEKKTVPLSVQAGITASCPLPLGFSGAISADLYRRNDSAEEFRTGLEIMYKELFALRLGYPVSISDNENDALSAGFAIKLFFADIEYAYQNRAALAANHIFGISIYFF